MSNPDGNGSKPEYAPDRSPEDIFPFYRRSDEIPAPLLNACHSRVVTALEFFSDVHSGHGPAAKYMEGHLEPYLASREAATRDMYPWIHVEDVAERLTPEGRVRLYLNAGDIVSVYQDTLIFWR